MALELDASPVYVNIPKFSTAVLSAPDCGPIVGSGKLAEHNAK